MSVKSFRDECEALAPLETFEPLAFRGNDDVPQALCGFVLALALIYNDCKDAIYAHVALGESKPEGPPAKTQAWGAISGAQLHAFRFIASVFHELFNLITDNKALLDHPFLVAVVQQLPARSREAWRTLVGVALGGEPTDMLGNELLKLRNNLSFHYGAKAIYSGYEHHFLRSPRADERAYVSRGDSMRATRFYFADAAALGYVNLLLGAENAVHLKEELADIMDEVNRGLMMVVITFVQRRQFPFRHESKPS